MSQLLEVRKVTHSFGGLVALKEVDAFVNEGEILGLIGPNGSGKTTLFNCITGVYRPTSGSILLGKERENLVGLKPHEITEKGIGRTFQTLRLFPNMTVLEHLLAAMHCRTKTGALGAVFRPKWVAEEENECINKARTILSMFGPRLAPYQSWPAQNLSYANRRRLEVARALATDPVLLLLDEPSAGMNPAEKNEVTDQIRRMRDSGHTILLIEHDMKVVMGASDRVVCIDHGEKIAEGSPKEVASHPYVVEAYLGRRRAHA